jgi:hypothetical protein
MPYTTTQIVYKMDIRKLRKEISQLIDNIKEHSDYISDFERIPQVELDLISAKIKKLHERTIIFSHEYEQELLSKKTRTETTLNVSHNPTPTEEPETIVPEETVFELSPEPEVVYTISSEPAIPSETLPQSVIEPESIETQKETALNDLFETKIVLQEDHPEQKTINYESINENLTEDKPEEKLVKEEPGTHIFEQPVHKAAEHVNNDSLEQEKIKKAELHEKLKSASNIGSLNERIGISAENTSISSRLKMNAISDLTKAIGINEKFLFIKELFNNDSESFVQALQALNNFGSLSEAESYLTTYLSVKFNWEKHPETVAKLHELVQRRYL